MRCGTDDHSRGRDGCDARGAGGHDRLSRLMLGSPGVVVVDVREEDEFVEGRIEPSVHIPLRDLLAGAGPAAALVARWRESPDPVIVYCRGGVRSAEATQYLLDQGVDTARSLDGGIVAWLGHR